MGKLEVSVKTIINFFKWFFRARCSVCGASVDSNSYSPICDHCSSGTPPPPPPAYPQGQWSKQTTPTNKAMNAIAWASSELKMLSSKEHLTQFEEGALYAVKIVCGLGATAS